MNDRLVIKLLIGAVLIAAAIACAMLPGTGEIRSSGFLLVVAATVLAGLRPVRIEALRLELTATDALVFFTLASLGPVAAVIVAAAGLAGATLGRGRSQASRCQLFNLGNQLFSVALAGHLFVWLGGIPGRGVAELSMPLVSAAGLYFLISAGMTTTVITLETRTSPVTTWLHALWTLLPLTCGVLLAGGLLWATSALGPAGVLLGLPPIGVIVALQHFHGLDVQKQTYAHRISIRSS